MYPPQAICTALRETPTLTILHLACLLDFKLAASHPEMERHINVSDGKGRTPLMLAVQKENAYMITYLVGKSARVDNQDEDGNSVYHYAAMTTKDIVEVRKAILYRIIKTFKRKKCFFLFNPAY